MLVLPTVRARAFRFTTRLDGERFLFVLRFDEKIGNWYLSAYRPGVDMPVIAGWRLEVGTEIRVNRATRGGWQGAVVPARNVDGASFKSIEDYHEGRVRLMYLTADEIAAIASEQAASIPLDIERV